VKKRWSLLTLIVFLAVVTILASGCGGGGDAASSGEAPASSGGPVGQADVAACKANRSIIATASDHYYAMEGAYPRSVQDLVPGYLQSVPTCPSGGSYVLQGNTVTCTVHGK
jgi:hypothetical protein